MSFLISLPTALKSRGQFFWGAELISFPVTMGDKTTPTSPFVLPVTAIVPLAFFLFPFHFWGIRQSLDFLSCPAIQEFVAAQYLLL